MKFLVGFFIASLALNAVYALPARAPKNDAEVVDVKDSDEQPDFKDFKGVIDTGDDSPFLRRSPSWFSFDVRSFADLLKDLRSRLCLACEDGGIGGFGGIGGIGGISGIGGIGEDGDTVTSIKEKGKTTSTVKVVDGHKVEINETVYDKGDSLFKVRVVNVRPLESGEEVEETSIVSGDDSPSDDTVAGGNAEPVTTEGPEKTNPRSELLESDEQEENEIRRGDGQTENTQRLVAHAQPYNTMLPTTQTTQTTTQASSAAINEDDVANLNGAFVTDNSLVQEEAKTEEAVAVAVAEAEALEEENGYGNFKAETNKSENDSDKMGNERDENLSTASTATTDTNNAEWSSESELEDGEDEGHHLTIGNNEESEVNDNFNESSVDDVATTTVTATIGEQELTKELNERMELIELSDRVEEDVGDAADTDAGAIDEEQINEDAVEEDALNDNDNLDAELTEPEQESIVAGEREDVVSSDDESAADDVEPVKMSSAFNSEWESLADDLSNSAEPHNPDDLSNDIDSYDAIAYDLSNDIAVNDIAAAQPGYELNPDAELIDGMRVQ